MPLKYYAWNCALSFDFIGKIMILQSLMKHYIPYIISQAIKAPVILS